MASLLHRESCRVWLRERLERPSALGPGTTTPTPTPPPPFPTKIVSVFTTCAAGMPNTLRQATVKLTAQPFDAHKTCPFPSVLHDPRRQIIGLGPSPNGKDWVCSKGSGKPPFLVSYGTSSPTPPGPCIHNIGPVHRFPRLCLCFCPAAATAAAFFKRCTLLRARCRRSFQPVHCLSSSPRPPPPGRPIVSLSSTASPSLPPICLCSLSVEHP